MTFRKRTARGNPAKRGVAKGAPRTASNAFVQALNSSKARDIEVHCWPHAQWTWTPFPNAAKRGTKWLRVAVRQ